MALAHATGFPVDAFATGTPSLSITPAHVGDIVILGVYTSVTGNHITAVSSPNVSWKGTAAKVDENASQGGHLEIWWGIATAITAGAVAVTWSTANAAFTDWCVDSWTGQGSGTWTLGGTGQTDTNTASTTAAKPLITTQSVLPTGIFAWLDLSVTTATPVNGTPANWTYHTAVGGDNQAAGLNLAASTSAGPTWGTVTSSASFAISAEFYVATLSVALTPSTAATSIAIGGAKASGLLSPTSNAVGGSSGALTAAALLSASSDGVSSVSCSVIAGVTIPLVPVSVATSATSTAIVTAQNLTPVATASSSATCTTVTVMSVGWVNYNAGTWSWSNSLDVSYWINPPGSVTAAWTTGSPFLWETAGIILTFGVSLTPHSAATSNAFVTVTTQVVGTPVPIALTGVGGIVGSVGGAMLGSVVSQLTIAPSASSSSRATCMLSVPAAVVTPSPSQGTSSASCTVSYPQAVYPLLLTGVGGTLRSVGTTMLGSIVPLILLTPSATSSSGAVCTLTIPTAMSLTPTSAATSAATALVFRPGIVVVTPTSAAISSASATVTRPSAVPLTPSCTSTSTTTCSVVFPGEVVTPIPTPITPVFVSTTLGPAVKWDWYLATPIFSNNAFQGFSNIGLLDTAQNRSVALSLNGVESAAFSVNILDSIAEQIWLHTLINCLVLYRNDEIAWSGPLWTARPTVNATTQTLQVTAVGWFQYLLKRLLKCGVIGVNPMVGPTSTTSGITHTPGNGLGLDPTAIAVDLIERTNFEYPLPISVGSVEPNPHNILWNVTYQQLQNIGQAIQTLSNVEGGFDFRVDPATLQLDFYYGLVKGGSTVYGRGQDRPNAVFSCPGNLTELTPTEDASNVATQMTVLDQLTNSSQYPGPGEITESIHTYGMMQDTASLSDINSLTITTAYAESEVLFREAPEVIWTFTPFAYHGDADVPQPFVDYDIGDFVYLTANYGCLQIPLPTAGTGPMPIRMFSFTITLDNEGNEMISNVQSVFTSTS